MLSEVAPTVQALSSFRPIWRKIPGAVSNQPALTFATCCKIPANLPE
jgi:hypothetical protein